MILLTVDEIIGIHEKLTYTQAELSGLGLDIASGKADYEDVLTWIREHRG